MEKNNMEKKLDVEKNVDDLLKRWHKAKEEISKLENLIDECKTQAEYLLGNNKTELSGNEFFLDVKKMTRETLSKKYCPPKIWEQYAKKGAEFKCYRVMRIEDKNKRSPRRSPSTKRNLEKKI